MNSRVFGAQPKMSQYPDILDFTPAAHPLNSSLHGQVAQRPESTPPTPGLWGTGSSSTLDNGVAPILSLEKDFCSNFTCCGLALADMHQLLDHFEEAHVVVVPNDGPLSNNSTSLPATSDGSVPAFGNGINNAGWTSMAVGYPQPFPPADASFGYSSNQNLIDTNFLLPPTPCKPASSQQPQFDSLDLDLDLDFINQSQPTAAGQAFDPFRLDFDLDTLSTRPSSPSASSTFSTPSLAWSDSSSSQASFGALPGLGNVSQPSSGHSSPGYVSPVPMPMSMSMQGVGVLGDVEAMCLPPALLSIRPQPDSTSVSACPSTSTSAMPSARSSPEPAVVPLQAPQKPAQVAAKKDSHSDVEESREKEKRTTVGKIKAKIFGSGSHGRSERRSKGDGYSKKRDPRREKAYKCPKPGCIKSYLNPNGLKYHLEKGTCIIDPLYRPPTQDPTPNSAAANNANAIAAADMKRAASLPTNAPTLTATMIPSIPAHLTDSSIPEPLKSLPTPLLPVKSEPSSPPLTAIGLRGGQQQQGQGQNRGPFYYAYTFPFQYGTAAQIPNQ